MGHGHVVAQWRVTRQPGCRVENVVQLRNNTFSTQEKYHSDACSLARMNERLNLKIPYEPQHSPDENGPTLGHLGAAGN